MKNLKKLVYKYKYLKLEKDDLSDEHSKLITKFESSFESIIPKKDSNVDKDKSKRKKPKIDSNVKDLYKKIAKKLHPDKGGDEEDFKELNIRYKSNDLLGVVDFAIDNNIEVELKDEDEKQLINSIEVLTSKIGNLKTTLAYVWEYGNVEERMSVINTLGKHLNKKISLEDLSDEIKNKLDFKVKK
tara:strand:+ start:1467 stop:2024 length:558 start_codon:yes stop_codon:yes gene_type:complete